MLASVNVPYGDMCQRDPERLGIWNEYLRLHPATIALEPHEV